MFQRLAPPVAILDLWHQTGLLIWSQVSIQALLHERSLDIHLEALAWGVNMRVIFRLVSCRGCCVPSCWPGWDVVETDPGLK